MSSFRLRIRAAAEHFGNEIADILESSFAQDDPWIAQTHSPLGRRRHLELVRNGELPARRDKRLVLVRRSAIDAYLEQRPVVPVRIRTEEEDDDEEEILKMAQRGGLEPAGKRGR